MRNADFFRGAMCGVAAFFCLAVSGQEASGQPAFSFVGSLRQFPTVGGSPQYSVSLSVQTFFSLGETAIESLVAPDGTAATPRAHDRYGVSADDLSLEEAQSLFSGAWTFTETRGDQPLRYQFDLPELSTSLFPAAPVIVSPAEGDTVRSDFLLDWEYPGGRTGNGLALRSSGSSGVRPDFRGVESLEDSSALVPLVFPDVVTEGDFTLRVGQLQSRFFDVTPVSSGADASFVIEVFSITSYSLPVTVTAVQVPEPTIAPLLTVLVTVSIRRRS